MRDEQTMWDVKTAKAWLYSQEWGKAVADTLEEDPSDMRRTVWLQMVMDMYLAMQRAPVGLGADELARAGHEAGGHQSRQRL